MGLQDGLRTQCCEALPSAGLGDAMLAASLSQNCLTAPEFEALVPTRCEPLVKPSSARMFSTLDLSFVYGRLATGLLIVRASAGASIGIFSVMV